MTFSTGHRPPSRRWAPALALLFALWGCRNDSTTTTTDASGDAPSVDAAIDRASVDASADVIPDDLGGDVSSDQPAADVSHSDVSTDAAIDAFADTPSDAAADVTLDAAADVAADVAPDAADVAPDLLIDAALDSVVDASADVTMGAVDVTVASDAATHDAPADTGTRDVGSIGFDVGSLVDVPPLPDVNLEGLPRDDAGHVILGGSGEGTIALEPGDAGPIQVLARCSVLVTNCVSPGMRTLDQCFASVRRCETAAPWNETPCCPTPCVTAYFAQRTAGAGQITSYDRALFGSPSCVAGVPDLGGL